MSFCLPKKRMNFNDFLYTYIGWATLTIHFFIILAPFFIIFSSHNSYWWFISPTIFLWWMEHVILVHFSKKLQFSRLHKTKKTKLSMLEIFHLSSKYFFFLPKHLTSNPLQLYWLKLFLISMCCIIIRHVCGASPFLGLNLSWVNVN